MGRLGWKPYDYWTSTPFEFWCACEGYNEAEQERVKIIRYQTYIIAASMAGSKALGPIEKMWPIGEVVKPEPISEERRLKILERLNKMKDARGT